MPRKSKIKIDSKIQQKLSYIGLDLEKIPKKIKQYTDINFRTLKGYDEKRYKQYRFINVNDIEILLSPSNRVDSIKEKYQKAKPLCVYLDKNDDENILYFTEFLKMLNRVNVDQIEEIEKEQEMLSKKIPFKAKFAGNYLWQIYYSEISDKYFMIVPTEDSDCSAFFYVLKKKLENNKNETIFVPISLVDYEGELLKKSEIKELENYLWLFTKDYPSIYEVYDKEDEVSLQIIGETEIYEEIKTLYKVNLDNKKEAIKFYKLLKALFILQTELPHYYEFGTNINKEGILEICLNNAVIKYENLPKFIYEQYIKSVSFKKKISTDLEEFNWKLDKLQKESRILEEEYMSKEKQITTFLECKKTFFGKVKYFFKLGKKSKDKEEKVNRVERGEKVPQKENKKEKIKVEKKNYTLSELEESLKELEKMHEELNNLIMDINALKLKNKNLKKKIENASNYIDEINKHKKSIFEFWKYSNKDAVAALDEGEVEELNVKKLEKVFNYEDDFEEFGVKADKIQRNKLTDAELESVFIASTTLLELLNRMNLKIAENKEISEELKKMKRIILNSQELDEEDEEFNIFGKIKHSNNKERTIQNKVHREQPRDAIEILEVQKGTKGIQFKRKLEDILVHIKSALEKNALAEDTYVYKASSEEIELDTIENVSLNIKDELDEFLENDKTSKKIYLYKIKLPKGTNYIAFTNIIFFDNKNMTLPVGMNLSSKILVDLAKLDINERETKNLRKLEFENEKDDFSKIEIKHISINELK